MSRQWIRAVGLTIEGAGGSLDLSNMRIKFEVKQDTIQTPNAAIIRVYNLARGTVAKLLKAGEFTSVTLSAGYVENSGVIFSGSIKQIQAGRETPVDTFVDIYAADGDKAYNQAVVNKTVAAGSTMKDHVDIMAQAMKPFGVTLGYVPTQLLSQIKYPRAVTFFGMAKDYLRTIAHSVGATWSIQEGELRIVESGKNLGGVRELNSSTGLIGMPIQTQDAILARCLIDAQIKIHSQVHINQAAIQPGAYDLSYGGEVANANRPAITADGIYTVYVINKTGDTHEQPWYMDLMCVASGQAIPAGSSIGNSPSAATPFTPQEAG